MRRQFDKPVLIAGGGIGGLAAALALAQRGIASHILEKRAAFSEDGAGIQVGPNGTRILEAIGALQHLQPLAAQPSALTVHDGQTGASLAELPLGLWMAGRFGAPYFTAHRQDLHQALLTAAQSTGGIEISTNSGVVQFEDGAHHIEAHLSDGTSAKGAALIVADGVRSELRAAVTGLTSKPAYAGKCAFRSVAPMESVPEGLARDNVHIWLAPGAHVVHYPVRSSREVALVAIFDDEHETSGWSTAVEPATVQLRAAALAPKARTLLDAATGWRKWALVELSMPASWSRGRTALLGDAAHPVLPFLAQGAVMALEDAMTVAFCLSEQLGGVAAALERYKTLRRSRCLRVQSASQRNGRLYHLAGSFARVRNSALRVAPPNVLMAQYDWLYGWAPPA